MINHLQGAKHRIRNPSETPAAKRKLEHADSDFYSESEKDEGSPMDANVMNKKQKKINETLIDFIASTCQSLSVVENPHFQKFVNLLNKRYNLPCTRKVSNELIPDQVSKTNV